MSKKSLNLKMWLVSKSKQNRRIPAFISAKTNRKVVNNPKRRNWRTDKLGTRNLRKKLGRK